MTDLVDQYRIFWTWNSYKICFKKWVLFVLTEYYNFVDYFSSSLSFY